MTETQAHGPNLSAPQAIESEEAVLGCVLLNPEAYNEVAAFLKPDDFYLHKHRWIWDAFTSLKKADRPIDIITVSEELERHTQLAEVGGAGYLTRLINTVPTSLHAEAYGRAVQREAFARSTITAATEMAKIGYGQGGPLEMFNQVHSLITALGMKMATGQNMESVGEILSTYIDYLKALSSDPEAFAGTPTGLIDLDAMIGGLRAPDLITIAGRPGTGKTSLMLTVGLHASLTLRRRSAIFSLEMSKNQVVERLLSMMTGINVEILHRGALEGDDWNKIIEASSKLAEAPMYIDDSGAITPAQIEAKCHKLAGPEDLDLVIVDYLQLLRGSKPRYGNRVEEVSDVSRELKIAAKRLHVPLLAGAQLSRAIEQRKDGKPMLSDLRESGSIEQDSDIVAFLHQPEGRDISQIIVGKNRHGATGDVCVFFRKETASFHNAILQSVS